MGAWISRIALALGASFGLILVAAAGALFWWWDEARARASNFAAIFEDTQYSQSFADREALLDYLKDHPQDFSLICRTVPENGQSTRGISHLPREETPLASTKKVLVLAAYAREVSRGDLDPEERVRVSQWERYHLPNTDGGAHPDALQKLGIETRDNGTAADPESEVPLSGVARAMIRSSDNAATDYLIARLGEDKVRAVTDEAGLEGQEPVLPLLGTFLLWFELDSEDPDLAKQVSGERMNALRRLDKEEYAARVRELTKAYAGGEIGTRWRENGPPTGALRYQEDVTREFETGGTAEDYAGIMAGVASGDFISPEVSGIMRGYLDYPMEKKENREKYRNLGGKGGSLAGVLNQATYAVPKEGDYAGETRVTVLFVREMPVSAWLGAQDSEGFDHFLSGLATDEEFTEKVQRKLEAR